MNEHELRYAKLVVDLKNLHKKINTVYNFFMNDNNKYIKQITFQHKKLFATKNLIERVSNKKIDFVELKPTEIDSKLNDMETLLKDSRKILTKIIYEIENITGKKIKFKSDI